MLYCLTQRLFSESMRNQRSILVSGDGPWTITNEPFRLAKENLKNLGGAAGLSIKTKPCWGGPLIFGSHFSVSRSNEYIQSRWTSGFLFLTPKYTAAINK